MSIPNTCQWRAISHGLAVGLLAVLLPSAPAVVADDFIPEVADFSVDPAAPEHIDALRGGGFVIYMRHGATDAGIPDQIPVDLDDCDAQRPLTDTGRAELDTIAAHFARLAIPYERAISSPFCRAVESAERVFGEPVVVDAELRYTAAMPKREKAPAVARTWDRIATLVDTEGVNRVVVAHGPNIAELMDYLPPEGTLIIFRPWGTDFEYVASIEPAHWPVLLEQMGLGESE